MAETGYFQFPLCLLAFREDYKERLETIVWYCLCEHARRINPKFPKGARNAALRQAAGFLSVKAACLFLATGPWNEAKSFVSRWEGRHGKDALIRVGTTLLWEAHDNTGLSYREFSIVCAINSIIGRRTSVPIRITEPRIRVRAAGFKSCKVAQREFPSEQALAARLLTVNQVRYTLEKLHERRLFARARTRPRTVKYMLGVTDDQLRAKLLQSETYGPRFRVNRAKKDAELMAAIKSIKQTPTNVGKNQVAATSVPIHSQHGCNMIADIVPDINICSFDNGSLNNSPENICKQNIPPLSAESGGVDSKKEESKELDRSQFSSKELAFIDLYHQICLPTGLGFLPVTKRSAGLDEVLENFASDFDEDEWASKFREAIGRRREVFRTNPYKYNTLVQICWKLNY